MGHDASNTVHTFYSSLTAITTAQLWCFPWLAILGLGLSNRFSMRIDEAVLAILSLTCTRLPISPQAAVVITRRDFLSRSSRSPSLSIAALGHHALLQYR
jgi:hypothetical protein